MAQIDPRRSVTCCFWLLLATITVIVPISVAGHGQRPALFIFLVPASDGRAILLIATVLGGGGTPTDIICEQNCRPMGCNGSSCTALLTGFPPGASLVEGTVSVTISLSPTQTLESDPLSFRRFFVPTGTSLTIDVLSADGIPLLSDVTSGMSLAAVDPTVYPSLKLRATLSTDTY
jgi:hypothetical protein